MIELLVGRRADVTERRVTPTPIIERFDVEEKVGPDLGQHIEITGQSRRYLWLIHSNLRFYP